VTGRRWHCGCLAHHHPSWPSARSGSGSLCVACSRRAPSASYGGPLISSRIPAYPYKPYAGRVRKARWVRVHAVPTSYLCVTSVRTSRIARRHARRSLSPCRSSCGRSPGVVRRLLRASRRAPPASCAARGSPYARRAVNFTVVVVAACLAATPRHRAPRAVRARRQAGGRTSHDERHGESERVAREPTRDARCECSDMMLACPTGPPDLAAYAA
jgi:hypothetical protein